MLGLYDRTPSRRKVILDGWWQFAVTPDADRPQVGGRPEFPEEDSTRISVPGVWETELGFETYQGVAWYRKVFEAPFEGPCLLTFGAVAYQAQVWLNGNYLGAHEGDFTSFRFLTEVLAEGNELLVRVDNRHTDESLPKEVVDWYPYGGITRSVVCEEIGDAFIERLQIVGRPDGQVDLRALVRNRSSHEKTLLLTAIVGECASAQRFITLGPGVAVAEEMRLNIEDPEPWSPHNPTLYEAVVSLDDDVYVERIGLREIRTEGARLLLNGEPIWLRGVNRHEDHPDWGFALPNKIMQKDVDIIMSLGCNAVRGSHYPNHPTFLDLCDENGLLFFAEVPGWQYNAYQLSHSPTKDKLAAQLEEMVTEQFNHPSIIIWSLHNECDTEVFREPDLDVRTATEELFRLARSLDDSRLITYASHRHWNDKHFDLADVVCLNQYIGWYVNDLDGADFPEYLARIAAMVPDKPVLITEFGAEGLSGYHSMPGRKWSEEHQADHLASQIADMRANPHVAGCFVWQYCDVTCNPERAIRRARSMNNKGIVDEYRRPKLAYHAVAALFEQIADEDESAE